MEDKIMEEKDKINPNLENIQPVDMNVNIYEINKNINPETFAQEIEEQRLLVHKAYKKSKLISNIMMGVVICLIIAGIIMWSQNNDALKIVGYVLLGLAIAGMLVFYFINRGRLPKAIKTYIAFVSDRFNGYLYKDEKFHNVSCNPNEKIDAATLTADRCYTGIVSCGSRNIIHGTYLDHPFLVGDVSAVGLEGKKKQIDLFVGKYISYDNGFKFDGRIVINVRLKGEKLIDLPNDTYDLEQVIQDGQLTVWATAGLDYKAVINTKLLSQLKDFDVDESRHLLNLNIVIWGGHTAVYLSYDNSLMSFPFENPYNRHPIDCFKRDQDRVFSMFEDMLKEKTVRLEKVNLPSSSEE